MSKEKTGTKVNTFEADDLYDDSILDKILRYVNQRQNVALVCKKFYEAVCKIEQFRYPLIISADNIDENFESMMTSRRRFTVVHILQSPPAKAAKQVLAKYGASITKVTVSELTEDWKCEQLEEALRLMPNIEELTYTCKLQQKRFIVISGTLHLPKLRKITFGADPLSKLLERLPVGTLREVKDNSLSYQHYDLSTFFQNQPNIIKLELSSSEQLQWIHHLKLEEFTFWGEDCWQLVQFLETQRKLLKLRLPCGTVGNITVRAIAEHLKRLKSLSIEVEKVSLDLIRKLQGLVHLQELQLSVTSWENINFSLLANRNVCKNFPSILKLSLYQHTMKVISAEDLAMMQKAFPKLKELKFDGVVPVNFCRLLTNFTDLESVSIFGYGDCNFFDGVHEISHGKLKNMCVGVSKISFNDLSAILNKQSMPGLERLELSLWLNVNKDVLQMMQNLPAYKNLKLETLIIPGDIESSCQFIGLLNKLSQMQSFTLRCQLNVATLKHVKLALDYHLDMLKLKVFKYGDSDEIYQIEKKTF